ncbi:MAG: ATP-binding protein [Cyanobacteria bacterium P01_F01_bin.150]
MEQQPLETFKMETNFEGLIQLLAKSLYPDPDVFIRELIQNCHDSIIRRQELDANLAGSIAIEINEVDRALIFRDNGIGMNAQDIKQFLSVIGSTGTGTARNSLQIDGRDAACKLIGQFGIGMLSAFVVAEQVIVTTRKLGSHQAFAWHNYGSTDCELYPAEFDKVGTEIRVCLRADYDFMLEKSRLQDAIIKYCDFIQFEIMLDGKGPINIQTPPWHRQHWPSEKRKIVAYADFLDRRYPDIPIDVIPIELDSPYTARGAMYITNRRIPDVNTTGVMDIFVRRMFVREGDNTLLPPWAKFIRGIIDSPDLQPTAARDNIQRSSPSFEYLQQQLGDLILNRLSYLAQHEPRKFQKINHWHHYHLKGMAYFHDDFFEHVAELLLFETNEGALSIREYLQKAMSDRSAKTPIYYFAYREGAAQFYKLATARGWIVVNAGYQFEEKLLQKYAERHQHRVRLERLDVSDDPDLFQRLDPSEINQFRNLELDVEKTLRSANIANVMVQLRRFEPVSLPAVVIVSPESESQEKLRTLVEQPWFLEGLEAIASEAIEQSSPSPWILSLNVNSALIQQLSQMDRQAPLVKQVMLGLYNSAVLYSHNLLDQKRVDIMHGQFIDLFNMLLTHWTQRKELEGALWNERRKTLSLQMGVGTPELQTPSPPPSPPRELSTEVLKSLRMQLQPHEAQQLITLYPTIEALLQGNAAEIAAQLGLSEFIVQAIQAELGQN